MTDTLAHLITQYGYWVVAGLVCMESLGIPVPGETSLIAAGAFAATQNNLNVWLVVAAAALGGIVGDNIGYWVGRKFGYWLMLRYGHYVGITDARIKLGRYLFVEHGGRVVFVGRFVPVLREIAALMAGVNHMSWRTFLVANAAGAVMWASLYGFGAYLLGEGARGTAHIVQIGIWTAVCAMSIGLAVYLHKHEKRLEHEAQVALPGPLRPEQPPSAVS